jgi:hypothetical protein
VQHTKSRKLVNVIVLSALRAVLKVEWELTISSRHLQDAYQYSPSDSTCFTSSLFAQLHGKEIFLATQEPVDVHSTQANFRYVSPNHLLTILKHISVLLLFKLQLPTTISLKRLTRDDFVTTFWLFPILNYAT